jgi:hypothetical protein
MEDPHGSSERRDAPTVTTTASHNDASLEEVRAEQDRAREALRRRLGELNVAVSLIREVRGE